MRKDKERLIITITPDDPTMRGDVNFRTVRWQVRHQPNGQGAVHTEEGLALGRPLALKLAFKAAMKLTNSDD